MSAARGSFPPTLKRLGQHFLTDERVVQRIADALEIEGGETVVEIGPGRGVLTDLLAERVGTGPDAGRLVAIELDRALAGMLRMRYVDRPNVQIVEHDVLKVQLGDVAGGDYVLAGNVPYYITTPILFHVLEPPSPRRAIFLVQREVAERAVSPPGGKTYGALSVNLQAVAKVEYLFDVPPGAFTPPPKVDSAVIRITRRPESLVLESERKEFQRFTQALFGLRRKQMTRVLRTVLSADAETVETLLHTVDIDPTARPETVAPETLAQLFRAVRQREG